MNDHLSAAERRALFEAHCEWDARFAQRVTQAIDPLDVNYTPYILAMKKKGIRFVQFGWNQTSELADLPMWLIFIAWPLTGWFVSPPPLLKMIFSRGSVRWDSAIS